MSSDKRLAPEYERIEDMGAFKSTIVSIVPFPIVEEKPGLIPGHFEIEACMDGRPKCLVVGNSAHYVWIDEVRGSLRVVNPSYVVARSVVADYLSGQLGATPDAYPGIFWLPEVWTPDKLLADAKMNMRILEANRIQVNWFMELVRIGDDDWQRTRQHSAISDLQRHAAKALDPDNKAGRPWIFVTKADEPISQMLVMAQCPNCLSEIPKAATVCRFCQRDVLSSSASLAKTIQNTLSQKTQ